MDATAKGCTPPFAGPTFIHHLTPQIFLKSPHLSRCLDLLRVIPVLRVRVQLVPASNEGTRRGRVTSCADRQFRDAAFPERTLLAIRARPLWRTFAGCVEERIEWVGFLSRRSRSRSSTLGEPLNLHSPPPRGTNDPWPVCPALPWSHPPWTTDRTNGGL